MIALLAGLVRGSGENVISVPSAPGPAIAANSSSVMPSPPISGALTPCARIWRTIRPPASCRPPQNTRSARACRIFEISAVKSWSSLLTPS